MIRESLKRKKRLTDKEIGFDEIPIEVIEVDKGFNDDNDDLGDDNNAINDDSKGKVPRNEFDYIE